MSLGTEEGLAPDSIEPLIGIREWQLENGRLKSLTTRTDVGVWEPGVPQHAAHEVSGLEHHGISFRSVPGPVPGCSCGIYAWKDDLELAINPAPKHQIAGQVKLWGKIVVHKSGYRAEWAQPSAFFQMQSPAGELLDPPEYRELLAALGELYQVPLIARNPFMSEITPWGVCSHSHEDCKCVMHWNTTVQEWHGHPPDIWCYTCQEQSGGERGHWSGD